MTKEPVRLVSLDVFRGLTMAAMVTVNTPGSWSHIYPPLRHAQWHGCTPTDLVFPFFLFIVGTAMAFSLPKQEAAIGRGRALHLRILRRGAVLFGLGLFLNGFPGYELATLRIPGVLQRISICYVLASFLVLHAKLAVQIGVALATLVGYHVVLAMGELSPGSDLGARIDVLLLGEAHLYKGSYDPEGLLSTVPAAVNTLFGYWAGLLLRARVQATRKLLIGGLACIVVGLAWSELQPLNKQLWTSSFVVLTSGVACAALAISYELVDSRGWRALGRPFEVFGRNAILLFVGSGLVARILARIDVTRSDGEVRSAWTFAYESFFAPTFGAELGSLLQALVAVLFWWLILLALHAKRIYLKV